MSIRQYYHSITNQPIQSSDFDADSDGEDTEWQRKASGQLIEEFIDVNRGEKELMKLWNYFISKNTQYVNNSHAHSLFVVGTIRVVRFRIFPIVMGEREGCMFNIPVKEQKVGFFLSCLACCQK